MTESELYALNFSYGVAVGDYEEAPPRCGAGENEDTSAEKVQSSASVAYEHCPTDQIFGKLRINNPSLDREIELEILKPKVQNFLPFTIYVCLIPIF